ncbi:MAG: extracellular solute-binding protein [Chloroflexi bacterium]|nr:extracellular solute-binding protein [Chloroflexota bacterium]
MRLVSSGVLRVAIFAMVAVLASLAMVATGAIVAPVGAAQANCVPSTSQQLIVYHAGSLSAAFTPVEQAFTCQTGVQVSDVTGGSVDLVRQVTAGGKSADIVASADYVDIDNFLKPAGAANYNIIFAKGRMVLAYTASGVAAKNLPPFIDANADAFNPPNAIPTVNDNWYQVLLGQGIVIGGSHPFLDPSGYRSHLMFQLTQMHYDMPNLYNNLLGHYVATPATAPANAFAIGKQYDFQFIYEHSAAATAQSNPDYRYAYLPDDVDMSNSAKNALYKQAVVTMPGLALGDPPVDVQGSRVAWGLTIMNSAPNRENAIAFLQLLLTPGGVGQSTLDKVGPSPVTPAVVSADDHSNLPAELQPLTTSGDPLSV